VLFGVTAAPEVDRSGSSTRGPRRRVDDGFGDAPVTRLGQEATGRSVVGHDELHAERKGRRGRERKRAARRRPTPFRAAVAGEKNGVKGGFGMGRERVPGGGAGGALRRQVGRRSAGSGPRAAKMGGHDRRGAREGVPGSRAAIGARVGRPEGIVAFSI
jgi:hypothetical protein